MANEGISEEEEADSRPPDEESPEDDSSEEDSPEESPEDDSSEEDSPEESPEDDSSEEDSPEESPEDDSSEEDSPEESPEDDSSEEDSPETGSEESEDELNLTLYGAFNLGWKLQYLRQAGYNRYQVYSKDDNYIISALSEVRDMLDTVGSSPAVKSEIRSFESELERAYIESEEDTSKGDSPKENDEKDTSEDENNDGDLPTLSAQYGNRLSNKVETWRTVLRYELAEQRRFTIADAPIIDIEEILQSPDHLFEGNMWEEIPEQTKQDLHEGCSALAANCPTASVIMVLRSIEYILREWYKQELDEEAADDTWGTVLGKLQSEFNNRGDDPDVLSNLDYLRRKRNEVNHPNRSPSLHEAAVTVAMASETISSMMEHVEVEDELEIEDEV
ncbi:hypothetical protein HTZ84_21380 [Haloterrigena sp. SYSU A558-1]|uniref:DUF4145 domain-containing protein n=1 Tax=Haloterrigena gelatinilytica TaxID=2741724 RepID=A0ABX2LNX1_9EURY|nr:hypothetical protein [Haloterrigena gelatinilytica]NUC74819.1 hypothetical protein [Haloterrigena gelatinilytica]